MGSRRRVEILFKEKRRPPIRQKGLSRPGWGVKRGLGVLSFGEVGFNEDRPNLGKREVVKWGT